MYAFIFRLALQEDCTVLQPHKYLWYLSTSPDILAIGITINTALE